MKKTTYILALSMLLTGCKPTCDEKGGHTTYILENNSNIVVEMKIMSYFMGDTIPAYYNALTDQGGVIDTMSTYVKEVKLRRGECIEDDYENGVDYWLYFFDYDTLHSIPWDTVRITGRGVLKRQVLDLQYLEDNNFTLSYP